MRQGIAACRAMGTAVALATFLTALAEVCAHAGQLEEAQRLLVEAQTLMAHTGERYWEAEWYRLRGELLLRQAVADVQQAESCFHQAIDIAGRQHAKSLELRATMSLSRLWQQQDKRAAAHELLAPIYGWFTEGFETRDLQDAKTLLDALAREGASGDFR